MKMDIPRDLHTHPTFPTSHRAKKTNNNPYAAKLRSCDEKRNEQRYNATEDVNRIDVHDSQNRGTVRDSFQTVEPPSLRPAGQLDDIPGATAVYPGNPLRQYEELDISGTNSLVSWHEGTPSSIDTAPVIEARLVRDSEIRLYHRSGSQSSPDNIESSRIQPSQPSEGGDNIARAVEVVTEDEGGRRHRSIKSLLQDWRIVAVLLILLCALVGLVVGLILSDGKNENELNGNTQFGNQTIFLTPEIISQNEKIAVQVITSLQTQPPSSMFSPGSTHRIALDWLISNSVLSRMETFQIVQRFALADLYFSTGGLNAWVNHSGWLSDDHECTWFQSDFTVERCTSGGNLQTLILESNGLLGTLPDSIGLLSELGTT